MGYGQIFCDEPCLLCYAQIDRSIQIHLSRYEQQTVKPNMNLIKMSYACSTQVTIFHDFLEIQKNIPQNFYKISNKGLFDGSNTFCLYMFSLTGNKNVHSVITLLCGPLAFASELLENLEEMFLLCYI